MHTRLNGHSTSSLTFTSFVSVRGKKCGKILIGSGRSGTQDFRPAQEVKAYNGIPQLLYMILLFNVIW